jgi:CRISPR-associated protein Cmr1
MYSLKLKLEMISPLFMYGAEKKGNPEIRLTEFKGLMRFWWRAVRALDDINALKNEEIKIFGGISEKESIKSPIKLSIKDAKNNETAENLKEEIRRYVSENAEQDSNAVMYLLYSVRNLRFYKWGGSFELTVTGKDGEAFKKAAASFWCLIYLGGVGMRSRRGAGNLTVIDAKGDSCGLEFTSTAENPEEMADWIVKNFNRARDIIGIPPNFCYSYSNLSFSRFIISTRPFNTWVEALGDIGKYYMKFRKENVRRIESGVFGLPVIHGMRVRNITKVFGRKPVGGENKRDSFNRRSSPLIIKIIKNGKLFYWLAIRLSGEFLPEGAVLEWNGETKKPSYSIIDEFWADLKEGRNEYILSSPERLDKIKEELISKLQPAKIVLFGSRARGDAGRKSDIDIGVETDRPLASVELLDVDLLNLNNINETFREAVERERVVLYERQT